MGRLNTMIQHVRQRGWFGMNFYRFHVLYFVLTLIISSVIMYGSGVNGNSDDAEALFRLRYIDAIFLCTSAMTGGGLNTVNLSYLTAFQQAVLFVVMLLGGVPFVSNAAVWIRWYFLRKYMKDYIKHSKTRGQMVVQHVDGEEMGQGPSLTNGDSEPNDSGIRRRRRGDDPQESQTKKAPDPKSHHEMGHGGLPYPWEWAISRKIKSKLTPPVKPVHERHHHHLSFKPSMDKKGRFHSLKRHEAEELGGLEYRALGVLLWMLPMYIIGWLGISMVILIPWSYRSDVAAIVRNKQYGTPSPGWWAAFLVVSGYGNVGFDLLDQNMIPFQGFYLVLLVIGMVTIAGNTFFPSFLRLQIWIMSKLVPTHSRLHHDLQFLLQHPRRCFILLFPSINTWTLTILQGGINLGLWVFFIILQIDYPALSTYSVGDRAIDGLFQAPGVRTSGYSIIGMSDIAPALLVVYTGAMYISGLPIIVSIRSSNVYEEKSLGIDAPEIQDDENESERTFIGTHLQRQLASDGWWVGLAFFLICIVERDPLTTPAPGFSIYSVLFEVVSAFGTVGLSTGVPYDLYAFCGAWSTLSKLILMCVMLRGRHRGLPMAIDRAVLLPGEESMQKLDEEHDGIRDEKIRAIVKEQELDMEKRNNGESPDEGQTPEQDQETKGKMQWGAAEEKTLTQTSTE